VILAGAKLQSLGTELGSRKGVGVNCDLRQSTIIGRGLEKGRDVNFKLCFIDALDELITIIFKRGANCPCPSVSAPFSLSDEEDSVEA
jgi:hypothetical protein